MISAAAGKWREPNTRAVSSIFNKCQLETCYMWTRIARQQVRILGWKCAVKYYTAATAMRSTTITQRASRHAVFSFTKKISIRTRTYIHIYIYIKSELFL